jgi:D-alanyl-lipoteichoic acid acyltransferase DltB (MBOAT superfamily)
VSLLSPVYLLALLLFPVLYWLLPRQYRLQFIAVGTLTILAYFSPVSAMVLAMVAILTFVLQASIGESRSVSRLGFGLLALMFAGYKSVPLMHESILEFLPADIGAPFEDLLFIGFSFYMLKAMHILIERYKGSLAPTPPIEFFAYMMFLPTLLVGPIHRIRQFQTGWLQQSLAEKQVSLAVERLIWGYAKVVLLGGYLVSSKLGIWIANLSPDMVQTIAYLENLSYGLHLYFIFSGASDIAIAFAALLGFRINENFESPFSSGDIAEFWRRWHISLADWVREYIYGTLVSMTRRHQLALMMTMIMIGLWHEFSGRYLIWGAYHGLGLVVFYRWTALTGRWQWWVAAKSHLLYRALAIFVTFNFVITGFAITRAESSVQIADIFSQLFFGGV